jgi:hypothetical protein
MLMLNRYLDEILAGKKLTIRTLRDEDDFHEVFEKLSEVVKRG